MGRVRLRLVIAGALVVACGTGASVIDPDAGADAQMTDASLQFDVSSPIANCFAGGFIISGEPSSQPGFTAVGDRATLTTNDAGVSTLAYEYTDAAVTLVSTQLTPNVANVTLASGVPNLEAECWACVCLPTFYRTAMTADAGALVFSNGVAFVSATGTTGAATPCGDAAVQAMTWAVCQEAGASPTPPQPVNVPFITGTHTCQGMLWTATKDFSGLAGAAGSISIAQAGATLTVQYDAGYVGSGSIDLAVVTPNVAIGTTGQEVTLVCNDAFLDGGAGGAMPVTAASLVVEATTLVLSITGTMGSNTGCESATQSLVLACSP